MQLRDQFWGVLRTSRRGTEFNDVPFLTARDEDREFQLFEILVVEALRSLDPGRQWTISTSCAGQGIAFSGSTPPRTLNVPEAVIQRTLLGRTKRDAVISVSLLDEIEALAAGVPSEQVEGVIIVFGGDPVSGTELDRLVHLADSTPIRGTPYLLDARRFEEFWSADRPRVLDVLDRCLDENERQVLSDYLGSISPRTQTKVVSTLDRDVTGQTGKPLLCRLRLRQVNPMPRLILRAHFKRPAGRSHVEVVLPSKLAGPGVEVCLEGGQALEMEIRLRCLVPGRQKLGQLEVRSLRGVLIETVDLGDCEFEPIFEPPYFDQPNRGEHESLSGKLREVMNGAVQVVAILGGGGSGKSKFCEAVATEAVDLGLGWVRIRHPNSVTDQRRLICKLLDRLLESDGPRPLSERVVERLRCVLSPFPEEHRRLLTEYLDDRTASVAVEVVAMALFALISERIEKQPLLIHLHDLHWADGETLAILGETIDMLHRSQARFHPGVLFLLEGRDRESLRLQSGLFRPPEHWISFLDDQGYEALTLSAWTRAASSDFLDWVLEYREAASDGKLTSRLPLFEQLCEHILESSAGNPMHIIEQLKALIERNYARVSERGTVYLSDTIPEHLETPSETSKLIESRLDFLRSTIPDAADLLVVLGKIGRRLPGSLFRFICSAEPMPETLAALHRVDMSNVPRHAADEFEFAHENYYQVCRDAPISGHSELLHRAIDYFERQEELTPSEHFDAAFLMAHLDDLEASSLLDHATSGFRAAMDQNDDLLSLEFCRFLLGLPPRTLARSGLDPADLQLEQGVRQKLAANWNESLETLKAAERSFAERDASLETIVKRLACKADIVNALVTLMQTDEALAEVDRALHLIDATIADARSLPPAIAQQLEASRERFWHRRAVTLWYDGRHSQAAGWQRLAYSSARRRGDRNTQAICLREFGTLLLHRSPTSGRHRLQQGIELLRESGEKHHEPFLLLEAELLIAELLIAHWIEGETDGLAELKRRAQSLHFRCQEKAAVFEAPIAALVAGAACGLTDRLEEAHHWFKLATSTAMRARSYDEIWKGRLNLGQVCFALGAVDEARIHATEAARFLQVGLSDGDWASRSHRRVMLDQPLRHCLRLNPRLTSELARYLVAPDSDGGEGPSRPGAITGSGEPAQVLHVRHGEADYYLLE